MVKKSGYDKYDGIWGNPYYDDEVRDIKNFDFCQKIFRASPALVGLKPKNGWIEEQKYIGQPFDPSEYRLEPAACDHEHCGVCQYAISQGESYWANTNMQFILCDACHGHYIVGKQIERVDIQESPA